MSSKRRTLGSFLRRDPQPKAPSPPSSPVPRRAPGAPQSEEKVMSSEELQNSVESLEMILRSMDNVRDELNRYNLALREHANTLRQYAVNINMLAVTDDRGRNQGDDQVYEYLMLHSANYYDRYAESQEHLAKLYLEKYNLLNNFCDKHFKTMARDNAKLDSTLKDLTKKLSKLTHRTAPPGSANTQNASTVQSAGVHELFVTKLSGLSGQIQNVRRDHLAEYTKIQRGVDRNVGKVFRRCAQENYAFLGDALIKVGGGDAMGALHAWGVYADAGLLPPMDFDVDEVQEDETWDEEDDEFGDLAVTGRSQNLPPRPPSSLRHHSTSGSLFPASNTQYGPVTVSLGGIPNSSAATGYAEYAPTQPPPQVPQYRPAQPQDRTTRPFSPSITDVGAQGSSSLQQYGQLSEQPGGPQRGSFTENLPSGP